jgi:uncharacterized protein (DUF608 family)
MDMSSNKAAKTPKVQAGVPIGGVGTGGVELGPDGRFRNITINNNRCKKTAIPLAKPARE